MKKGFYGNFLRISFSLFCTVDEFIYAQKRRCGRVYQSVLCVPNGRLFPIGGFDPPSPEGEFTANLPIAGFGIAAGLVLSLMLFSLGRAVEKGPPGLTFSIFSSATVMPGLLMALVFGSALGFAYNGWHAIGSLLVLGGLFWAGKGLDGMKEKKAWILFCVGAFSMHLLLLSFYQFRAMLMNVSQPEEIVSLFTREKIHSEWFVPFMFLSSGLVQLAIYLRSEMRKPKPLEIVYGLSGGVTNILCTLFLIWATERASPLENAVIFPIWAVVGIILTNAWGQKLYQEQVNWRACQLCAFGLIVGTVDWKAIAVSIGF